VIAELDADDAFEILERAGAPVSIALTPEEMAVHPQIRARGIVADASGTNVIALPATLSANPARRSGPLPGVGEHPEGFAESFA
jgi:crotonobetainyl-CoA:carnitine CoA-transferase CaiB-like acyl-CoA transferase